MDEDFVVLLEPGVHLVPVERNVVVQLRTFWIQVAPGGLLGHAIADLDGEKARFSLAGMRALVARWYEQVLLHVFDREVIHRKALLLDQQHN